MDDATDNAHTISGWQLDFTLATSLYPSSIGNGLGEPAITDVNVGLEGVSTTFSDGIHLLLVGPGGQQAYLWGDAGGPHSLTGVDVTFDDEAASTLPDEDQAVGGSYRPPATASRASPPRPRFRPGLSLAVFDGLSANGTWQLFAFDDVGEGVAVVAGWWLKLTWSEAVAPAGTVTVNGGAVSTTSKNVMLDLSATDPAPSSGLIQMRFSNDGVTFSAYQAYTTMALWMLTGADGPRRSTPSSRTVTATCRRRSVTPSSWTSTALGDEGQPKKNAKDVKTTTTVKVNASEALYKATITT